MSPKAISILMILFTVSTNAAAQIMLKAGMMRVGPVALSGGRPPLEMAWIIGAQFWVLAGLITFAISMCCHLLVLSRVDLSFAYPFLSLAYVIVAVYSLLIFGEPFSALRFGGYGLIVLGTVLIAFS